MTNIPVIQPTGELLFHHFKALVNTLQQARGIPYADIQLDLSGCSFMYPLIALPLAALIEEKGSKFLPPTSDSARTYAKTIKFPNGRTSAFWFGNGSYIPICRLAKDPAKEREVMESKFVDTIARVFRSFEAQRSIIAYPIAEIVTNVIEHSRASCAWIFAQHYANKKYVDVCIADLGIGIRQCLEEGRGLTFPDDLAAIEAALKGISAKNDVERGFGIHTTKRLIFEGLKGEFLLCSGGAALISSSGRQMSFTLPSFEWPGVIVAFRIPHTLDEISLYDYVE